jgi:predicted RNA binding protein YcfA (HicA-like mRNA interferase family)
MAELYRELVAIPSAHGSYLVRKGKGSHEIWYSPISGKHLTVPRSANSRHTANDVLKQVGLPKEF